MTDAPRPSAATLSGGPRSALAVLFALVIGVTAACGNSAVVPAPGSTPFVASFAPASGSAAPSASAKSDPGTAAVTGFVALVTKKGLNYQATFTGQSRHSTDIFPISRGLLQVSGSDVLVRATWTAQGQHVAVEHRYVDGKAWVRFSSRDTWHRLTFHASDSMAAFAAIRGLPDVTYLGPSSPAERRTSRSPSDRRSSIP